MAIEREIDDAWSIRDPSVSEKKKRKRISLLLAWEEAEDFCFTRILGTRPRLSVPRPSWDI